MCFVSPSLRINEMFYETMNVKPEERLICCFCAENLPVCSEDSRVLFAVTPEMLALTEKCTSCFGVVGEPSVSDRRKERIFGVCGSGVAVLVPFLCSGGVEVIFRVLRGFVGR